MPTIKKLIIIVAIIGIIGISPEAWAQDFGKNKISRSQFDWHIYKTEHFAIYYYPDEASLVKIMGDIAERAYSKLSEELEHEIEEQVPLILYKSHGEFRQTNIILEELSEGVGGFSELFKRRVVIPYTGSMRAFEEVIFHELTHIFQFDILYQKPVAHIYTGEFLYSPPLWFTEGMADYIAEDWDTIGKMVLRTASISNSIVPLSYLNDFSPLGHQVFLGYKEGQAAIDYLAQTYGKDKLALIMQELKRNRTKNMDEALKNSIGIGLEEFDKGWQKDLKRRYWPMIKDKDTPDSFAKQLTGKDGLSNNFKPVWSPSGELIAYLTGMNGFDEIIIISAKDGAKISRITNKFHMDDYEEIRTEGSGLSWSLDGDKLAFIAGYRGKDYLFVADVITKKLVKKIPLNFDASYSPSWAYDNNRIAFAALNKGKSDIYSLSLDSEEIDKLTDDPYDDNSPSWHPKENKLVYSSERHGRNRLILMDLDAKDAKDAKTQVEITYGAHNAVSPSWSPDGNSIIFCSDFDSAFDIYTMKPDGSDLTRLTKVITGCFNPNFAPDKSHILFASYHERGVNDIYVMETSKALALKVSVPSESEVEMKKPEYELADGGSIKGRKYSLKILLDAIFSDFVYSSDGLFRSYNQLIASDMMGNHRFGITTSFLDFREDPDVIASYYYLAKRPDMGVALFNYHDYHIVNTRFGRRGLFQRNTGISGIFSYPLDRFYRIDLKFNAIHRPFIYNYEPRSTLSAFQGLVTSVEASFVKDTVMWSESGPYTGTRYNFSVERDIKSLGALGMTNLFLDARKYFKLGKRSTFAVRLLSAGSFGEDYLIYYLGGIDTIRGYEYEEFYGNKIGFTSFEVRVPFVDELRIGWPIPIQISGVRGVFFSDSATVWPKNGSETGKFKLWKGSIKDDSFRLVDLKNSYGVGLRLQMGFLALNFDVAKQTIFGEPDPVKFHFGLGQEF